MGPLPPTASPGAVGGKLIVAAHPDDDLFFMSPDLVTDVRQEDVGTTAVYVTAGDAGKDYDYWSGRITGVRAAYAQMAGVDSDWRTTGFRASDLVVDVHVLQAAPRIRLAFLHLPDGGIDGAGYPVTRNESLLRLRTDAGARMHTIEGRNQTYTADSLRAVLGDLIRWTEPDLIRTLDYTGPLTGDDDHPDHRATQGAGRGGVFRDYRLRVAAVKAMIEETFGRVPRGADVAVPVAEPPWRPPWSSFCSRCCSRRRLLGPRRSCPSASGSRIASRSARIRARRSEPCAPIAAACRAP